MMLANIFKKSNVPEYDTVKILKFYSGEESPFGYPTAIVYVENDSPVLCMKESIDTKNNYITKALTINNTPIVQYKISIDKNKPNLIATGDGLDDKREELQEIEDNLNLKYMGIKDGIDAILPILSNLKTGIYAIADIPHYPTDGENNFFWNIPNHMTESQASSQFHLKDGNTLDYGPRFLFPSHDTSNYNPDFVKECVDLIRDECYMRGVAFYLEGYMSLLLKGHNIATAAALSGIPINCITIIPATDIIKEEIYIGNIDSIDISAEVQKAAERDEFFVDNINVISKDSEIAQIKVDYEEQKFNYENIYKVLFGSVTVNGDIFQPNQLLTTKENLKKDRLNIAIECDLIDRKWNPEFNNIIKIFPKATETAQAFPFNLMEIEERYLSMWLLKDNYNNLLKLSGALSYLVRTKPKEVKSIALQIAKNFNKYISSKFDLIATAFKTLDQIEGDKEIDDFFISFLLCFGDDSRYKNTILEDIVNNHWNKKTHIERENSYDEDERKETVNKEFDIEKIPSINSQIIKQTMEDHRPNIEYLPIEDDFQDDYY